MKSIGLCCRGMALGIILNAGLASAQTNRTWNGSAGTDWFNPTNWTPPGVPVSNDIVNFTNTIGTIDLTAPVTINGQFNWSGGTLSGSPLTIATNGLLTISGTATLFLENSLTNAGMVVMTNSGSLIVSFYSPSGYSGLIENLPGALWDIQNDQTISPDYSGPAYFHNAGAFRKSGQTGTTTIYLPFNNSGSATTLQGTLTFMGGGTLAGYFTAANAASILFSGGDFTNSGPTAMNGPGVVQLIGGNITLLTDVITNLPLMGGNLILGPDFQGGAITNLTLAGSTLLSTNTVTGAFNWIAGTLAAPLTIATNGLLTVSGAATHYLENALTNAGTVAMTNSGSFVVSYSSGSGFFGLVENLPGALWDIQNDQAISPNYFGPAYFHNAGAFRKSGLTGTTTIYLPFNNSGSVTTLQGTLSFMGGGTLAGTFQAATNAPISFSGGSFTNSGPVSIIGPGPVQMTGGNLWLLSDVIAGLPLTGGTVSLGPVFQGGTITNLTISGATLTGTNIVTGTFNWDNGTILGGSLTIASNALMNINPSTTLFLQCPLTNWGSVTWANTSAGSLDVLNNNGFPDAGLIENMPGALFDIQCDQNLFNNSGAPAAYFHNQGTLQKSASTGTTSISIPVTNSGAISSLSGSLAFSGGFTPAGGALLFGLSSSSTFGVMSIAGNATLGGTIGVVWLNGFVPASGNAFTVLTYASCSGVFTNFTVPPSAAVWVTNYGPTSFTCSVATINHLAFTTQPVGGELTNIVIPPVVVQIEDPSNNPVAIGSAPIMLSLNSGAGDVIGTLTQNTDSSGKATFGDLRFSNVGSKTLRATSSGLTAGISLPFQIIPLIGLQLTNSGFLIQLNGANSHGTVTISATTNLAAWIPIYTNAPTNGAIQFLDTSATNYPARFYKIVEQ